MTKNLRGHIEDADALMLHLLEEHHAALCHWLETHGPHAALYDRVDMERELAITEAAIARLNPEK
ncbi:MAG TPA: hypothetical protein VF212_17590 [Longimicrobiales bacterium]